jgi:hypothetical protein
MELRQRNNARGQLERRMAGTPGAFMAAFVQTILSVGHRVERPPNRPDAPAVANHGA